MLAGTSTQRTMVASTSRATATPKPICWNMTRSPAAKPPKTAMMISAAPVMSRAVEPTPNAIERRGVAGLPVALLDPAEQEHLVVHREAEEDREQEERHPGLDRVDLLEAEELVPDALLEDEHEQSVGGCDRQQVERDRDGGMTIERKATVSRTKLSPSTKANTIGSQVPTMSK